MTDYSVVRVYDAGTGDAKVAEARGYRDGVEAKQVTRSDFQIADATIKLAWLKEDIRRARLALLYTAAAGFSLGAMTVIGLAMGFGGH